MAKKSAFMVEDEALLRDLFAEYVHLIPNLELIGSSGDGSEAMKQCLELKPDLIILDIRLPEVNGLEMLLLLRKKLPDSKILIFTGSLASQNVRMAIDADADGFVEKAYGLEQLKDAIVSVLEGKRHFSPGAEEIRKKLIAGA